MQHKQEDLIYLWNNFLDNETKSKTKFASFKASLKKNHYLPG